MSGKNHSGEKAAFWRLVMEEFGESGLSVRAFCRREGLSAPSFYAWRRKLHERDRSAPVEVIPEEALVPVTVTGNESPSDQSPRNQASPLEVVTPSGFTLRFPGGLEPRQLGALLTAISPCRGELSRGAASC